MKFNGDGRRERVLRAVPPFEPAMVADLFGEYKVVLERQCKTDAEREIIQEHLASFEVRSAVARLCDHLTRRAPDADDRWILETGRRFMAILPEPLPEPPEDPQLEQLILAQVARRDDGQATLEAVRRQLTTGLVELREQQQRKPKADHAVLKAQLVRLQGDVEQARDAVDREAGRLAQLLTIRANRRRALALAAATK
jgi:hypothetical protein